MTVTLEDVEEFMIIENRVTVNGAELNVSYTLDDSIDAVQYLKSIGKVFEEVGIEMTEVPFAKYQHFVEDWITLQNKYQAEYEANKPTPEELAIQHATMMIDQAIQMEIIKYNKANGIGLFNVHNAESYSRMTNYTHQPFCEAVWIWSVELWEFMRVWQDTLTAFPTQEEVLAKIAEKPFIGV